VKPEWFGASRIALCFLISLVLRGSRCGRTTMVDATDRSLRLEQQAGRSCLRRVRHRVVRQWDRAGLSDDRPRRALEGRLEKPWHLRAGFGIHRRGDWISRQRRAGLFSGCDRQAPLYITRVGGEHWSPIAPTAGPRIVGICAIDELKVDGKVLAVRAGGRVGGPAGMLESFTRDALSRLATCAASRA
jgi:hypothetical protein